MTYRLDSLLPATASPQLRAQCLDGLQKLAEQGYVEIVDGAFRTTPKFAAGVDPLACRVDVGEERAA